MISKGLGWLAAAAMWLVAETALANRRNLPEPQFIIARQIYDLHTLIMWIVVGIFVVVFGAMIYAIIRHRKSAGRQAQQFHENTTVEIVWTGPEPAETRFRQTEQAILEVVNSATRRL